jgi:predicted double-glycine peptidase
MVRALLAAGWLLAAVPASAASVLDVPYISQTESLCGGAAAAMVMRYWGERGIDASAFAPLVDRSAAGIRTTALVDDLRNRGWNATALEGSEEALGRELAAGRPVLALIEERPRTYHYVVVVGVQDRAVIFHDPARSPFRVMRRDEFTRRWTAAHRWMAIVLPGQPAASASSRTDVLPAPATGCDALVADGVARAQASDLAGAERALTSALACPGGAALRELAGVRALQRRWADAAELARAALADDPRDAYTWQLLGTSEFVQDRTLQALDAWNRAGLPRVDLIGIDGLERTRHRVVERLVGVGTHDLLTRGTFVRARRQLAELPAASLTRLTYSPVGAGLVELRGTVVERPLVPRDPFRLAAIGIAAASGRSLSVTTGTFTGGGESLDVSWRFWPNRPRVGFDLRAPAPFAGTLGIAAFVERQPFDEPSMAPSRRTSVRLDVATWIASNARVAVRGGLDRWRTGAGTFGSVGAGLRLVSAAERVTVHGDIDAWSGEATFARVDAGVRLQSSTARRGLVFTAETGADAIGTHAPGDLWPGGDTGWVRPIPLRAHPILSDGALKVAQLGRGVVYGSGEAQRWWSRDWSLLHVGAAAFVDTARTMRRLDRPARNDVDVGGGVRVGITGMPGLVRIDFAHGLRDGANALSVLYAVD